MFFFQNSKLRTTSWLNIDSLLTHGCSPGETRKSCLQGLPVGLHLCLTSWHRRNPHFFTWWCGFGCQESEAKYVWEASTNWWPSYSVRFDCLIAVAGWADSIHSHIWHMLGDTLRRKSWDPNQQKDVMPSRQILKPSHDSLGSLRNLPVCVKRSEWEDWYQINASIKGQVGQVSQRYLHHCRYKKSNKITIHAYTQILIFWQARDVLLQSAKDGSLAKALVSVLCSVCFLREWDPRRGGV